MLTLWQISTLFSHAWLFLMFMDKPTISVLSLIMGISLGLPNWRFVPGFYHPNSKSLSELIINLELELDLIIFIVRQQQIVVRRFVKLLFADSTNFIWFSGINSEADVTKWKITKIYKQLYVFNFPGPKLYIFNGICLQFTITTDNSRHI